MKRITNWLISSLMILGSLDAASSSSSSSGSFSSGSFSISVSASASANARAGGFRNNFFFWSMPSYGYGYGGYGHNAWGRGGYYGNEMIELYRVPGVHPWRYPYTEFSLQRNLIKHYYPEEVKDHPPIPPNTYSDP